MESITHFHYRQWEMVFHLESMYISMEQYFLEREVMRQEGALLLRNWRGAHWWNSRRLAVS